ncbi:MAG: AAA family ATPase [Tissierellia bacterium]|nr:AAA family ATPase [Tissierellia bacterium]
MIKSIHLKPFGHFLDKKLYFTSGINLIYAGNEAGKTTVFKALQASLLGFIPAGKNYPYFPWQEEELFLRAELIDGRIVTRRITSSISGFIEKESQIEVIANRPIDEISRQYLESFHLLDADNLHSLARRSMDEIIETYVEKLYLGQEAGYREVLALLDERKKAIYKKRGHNFLLAKLDEEIYQQRRRGLVRDQTLEKYKLKKEELQRFEKSLKSDLLVREKVKALNQEIQAKTLEMMELQRLADLDQALKATPTWPFYGIFAFIGLIFVTFGLDKIALNYAIVLTLLSFIMGLLYLYINRARKSWNLKLLSQAGFFNLGDFKETYRLQKQMDFDYETLVEESRALSEGLEFTASDRLLDLKIELARLEDQMAEDYLEVQGLEEKRASLVEEYNRYSLQESLLRKSYEDFREELLPEIMDRASHYLRDFTQKKYLKILTTSQDGFFLQSEGENLEFSPSMSKGLRSQFYLAIRLAFIDKMGSKLPVFYDEAFSNWDEDRLVSTLKRIQELPRQQFIFTCRESDALMYEEILGIRRIEL